MSDRMITQQFLDQTRLNRPRCSSTDGTAGSDETIVSVDEHLLHEETLVNNAYIASLTAWVKDEPWQDGMICEASHPRMSVKPVVIPSKAIAHSVPNVPPQESDAKSQRRRPGLSIFSHKGSWVRPSAISHAVSPVHRHNRTPPVEEQAGRIDSSAGVDVGHAILALEFIDRVNDAVLHQYLPAVDATVSKEYGLEHPHGRLATPYTPSSSSRCATDTCDRSVLHFEEGDSRAPSVSPCEEGLGCYAELLWSSDTQQNEVNSHLAHQRHLALGSRSSCQKGLDVQLPDCGADQVMSTSAPQRFIPSRASHTSTNEGSVGKPMTPSSCFETEPTDCQSPDLLNADLGRTAESPQCESRLANSEIQSQDSQALAPSIWKAVPELSLILSEAPAMRMPEQSHDPATARASMRTVYMPGAARSRRIGQYRCEAARLRRHNHRSRTYAQHHAQACSKMRQGCVSLDQWHNSMRSVSYQSALAPSMMASMSGRMESTLLEDLPQSGFPTNAIPGSSNLEAPTIAVSREMSAESQSTIHPNGIASTCRQRYYSGGTSIGAADDEQGCVLKYPSESGDLFLGLSSMNLQSDPGACSSSRREFCPKDELYEENEICPFSHENLRSSVAVTLRCGHRFALAQLDIARRGPAICASAGFAVKDALICPLCGDQDINTMPAPGEILTCFSKNTDAYLGELRKDWQKPLQIPSQNTNEAKDVHRLPSVRQATISTTGNKRQSLQSLRARK